MKKILYLTFLITSSVAFSQAHRFSDLAVLFSQQNTAGSARFTGLSGAMGALGGDLSTLNLNAAGLAVFNHHEFSLSVGTSSKNSDVTYYENTTNNIDYDLNFNQIGTAFIFEQPNNDWEKIVLGINYQKNTNYNNLVKFSGNSSTASFQTHPNATTDNIFDTGVLQEFTNETYGDYSIFNIGIASQYQKNFYLGGSLNFHQIDFTQETTLFEANENSTGQELNAYYDQFDSNIASGISLNIGMIYKVLPFLRIGIAYETPTFYYEVINESNIYDGGLNFGRTEADTNKDDNIDGFLPIKGNADILPIDNTIDGYRITNNDADIFEYTLRTPSKTNLSGAIVLGKLGLLSADYSYHNYNGLNLGGDFENENDYFRDVLQNTHNLNVGGEIRLKSLTLRGGASYTQSPFRTDKTEEIDVLKFGDKYGASLGAGLRLENHKFDISYSYSQQTNSYDAYDQYSNITPATIDFTQTNVNLTYTYIF